MHYSLLVEVRAQGAVEGWSYLSCLAMLVLGWGAVASAHLLLGTMLLLAWGASLRPLLLG